MSRLIERSPAAGESGPLLFTIGRTSGRLPPQAQRQFFQNYVSGGDWFGRSVAGGE